MAQYATKVDVKEVVDSSIDVHTLKLFKYLDKRFKVIDRRFDAQDEKIDKIYGTISNLAADLKTYHQELLMLGHKVDRLERWIHQIAQETGVKLPID